MEGACADGRTAQQQGCTIPVNLHNSELIHKLLNIHSKQAQSTNQQHQIDEEEVISKKYIPSNPDGTPYIIPKGHWFPGSMIPDFTNQQAREWWFSKRKYLLDIGVDGFKTDGGELNQEGILTKDLKFQLEKK